MADSSVDDTAMNRWLVCDIITDNEWVGSPQLLLFIQALGVFLLNLENRVIPRCSVFMVLHSKRLVKTNMSLSTFIKPSEKQFLDKFVTKYIHIFAQLLNVYQRKEGRR
ncbi:hypothetical protein Dsin_025330 [Dipteronia sinensis]|uniref:Uncharacterized protein n=1 Tax=Dipteronia sinensis TaxID=43782 RepID=A0AAD9ZVX7_9ROSI|nr:hypothetical protein Dsin_025330 [Dipteronia sinensis]